MTPAPRASVRVFDGRDELAHAAAERMAGILTASVAEKGLCRIALAGGETPLPAYGILASTPYREHILWSGIHLYFTDERMVPPDNPSSNHRMISEALLTRIRIPAGHVHRIPGELEPSAAARGYAAAISDQFGDVEPRFDLVVLGLGEDGHTASLFPGTEVLDDRRALVREVFVPRLRGWRVTMTLRLLNAAHRVLFLVTGENKAPAVAAVLDRADSSMPASLIQPTHGTVEWFMDLTAASSRFQI